MISNHGTLPMRKLETYYARVLRILIHSKKEKRTEESPLQAVPTKMHKQTKTQTTDLETEKYIYINTRFEQRMQDKEWKAKNGKRG